jgi:hypothetical protein
MMATSKQEEAKLKKQAKAQLDKAKKQFKKLETKVKGFTKKSPGKALLIATAVGTALGAGVAAALKKRKK